MGTLQPEDRLATDTGKSSLKQIPAMPTWLKTISDRPLARPPRLFMSDWLVMRRLVPDIICAVRTYAHGALLDAGCGPKQYYSYIVPHVDTYTGLDCDAAHNPDVVGSVADLPFPPASFDTVLSTQVLEHVTSPERMLSEIARVLTPDGILILSAPQAWRIHSAPVDYYRFTRHGLEYLLGRHGFETLALKPQGNVWAVVGQTINNYLNSSPHFYFRLGWRPLVVLNNLFFAALDGLLPGYADHAETLNYLVVARKVGEQAPGTSSPGQGPE